MEKKLTIKSTKKELLAALNKEKNNSKIIKDAAEDYLNGISDEDSDEYTNLHFALKGTYPERIGSLIFYIKGDSSQELFKYGGDTLESEDFKIIYKNKEVKMQENYYPEINLD